jgi:hypothetical protein
MQHGSLDIAKLGDDPIVYAVTFAAPHVAEAERTARTFAGLPEVDEFLRRAGVARDRIEPALGQAEHDGAARLDNIVIEERELHELGLRPTPRVTPRTF